MDNYFELKIKINPEISEIISDICFENLDCEGVVLAEEKYEDDLVLVSTTEGTLKVYLKSTNGIKETLSKQRQLLLSRGFSEEDLGCWDFEISKIADEDWSKKWKENWDVTHVTERITVVPSWIEYTPNQDEVIITLDPGSAFGTGTHATTQLCMRATEKYMQTGSKMADIGTGSGILAICAAKLGAQYAYGCDNDALVIKTAQENALLNNASENCFFECKTADLYMNDLMTLDTFRGKTVNHSYPSKKIDCPKFDFITANILHNVLADIMGDLKALMKDDATLILSGILDEKKQVVIEALKKHNMTLKEEMHQDIWVALITTKN